MAAHYCISFPCPLCYPGGSPWHQAPVYSLPPAPIIQAPGCVCPPTSEKTCQAPMCPRKPFSISASGIGPNQ